MLKIRLKSLSRAGCVCHVLICSRTDRLRLQSSAAFLHNSPRAPSPADRKVEWSGVGGREIDPDGWLSLICAVRASEQDPS